MSESRDDSTSVTVPLSHADGRTPSKSRPDPGWSEEIITYAPGEDPLVMRFAGYLELDDEGLIRKLDIFWKTPPTLPPDRIAVDSIIGDDTSGAEA